MYVNIVFSYDMISLHMFLHHILLVEAGVIYLMILT